MSKPFPVDFIHYEATRPIARQFLDKYHPSCGVPVPIENIIDNQMGINIVPIEGLLTELRGAGGDVAGLISADLKNIYVDKYIYLNQENLFRFTLAHELGHAILHRKVFEQRPFRNIDEYLKFLSEFQSEENDFRWYEIQANNFAGLILAPEQQLDELVAQAATKMREQIATSKIALSVAHEDEAWEYLYQDVAETFAVSSAVIEMRVRFDRLRDKYRLL